MNIVIRKASISNYYIGKKIPECFFRSNNKSLEQESDARSSRRVISNKVKIQSKVFSNHPIPITIYYLSIRKRELEFKKSFMHGINDYSDKGAFSFNKLNKM